MVPCHCQLIRDAGTGGAVDGSINANDDRVPTWGFNCPRCCTGLNLGLDAEENLKVSFSAVALNYNISEALEIMEPVSFTQNCGVPDNASGCHRPQANRSLGAHFPVSTRPAMLRERAQHTCWGERHRPCLMGEEDRHGPPHRYSRPVMAKTCTHGFSGHYFGHRCPWIFYGNMKVFVLFSLF